MSWTGGCGSITAQSLTKTLPYLGDIVPQLLKASAWNVPFGCRETQCYIIEISRCLSGSWSKASKLIDYKMWLWWGKLKEKSGTYLSKDITDNVRADSVAVSVDAGHKTWHKNAPYGQTYPLSSSTKSNGMLSSGVRKSQALRFSKSMFDGVWRRRRLRQIK